MSEAAVAPAAGRASRERRPAQIFNAAPPEERKVRVGEGAGTPLGELAVFREHLDKIKSDDELLRALHSLLFGGLGSKQDRKKNLRLFSGFDAADQPKALGKLVDKKRPWTVAMLKRAAAALGLAVAGSREELCGRIADFLAAPHIAKKRKASTGGAPKTKRVRKGKAAQGGAEGDEEKDGDEGSDEEKDDAEAGGEAEEEELFDEEEGSKEALQGEEGEGETHQIEEVAEKAEEDEEHEVDVEKAEEHEADAKEGEEGEEGEE